jgi:polysaccharide export outer membrane protein
MYIKIKLQWFDMRYLFLVAFLVLLPIQQSNAVNNIGPDDILRISVYGYEDLKTETRVSTDGRITFPLIGEVAAGGKSTRELEEAIAARLIDDGSIVDLIAMAGGINDEGDSKVVVTRTVDGKPQKQELNLRVYLEAGENIAPFKMQQGDVVYVPKAPMFYIYGEVQKPGGYRIEPGLSVVKALSIGGGLTLRGTENGIVIKRKTESGALQEIDAELGDTVLKDDVIYIGERWF